MHVKTLEKILLYLVALSFFVPLLAIPSQFIFPFVVPKILVFRSLALLMLAVYVLLLGTNWRRYRIHNGVVTTFVLLFFVSFIVSTFVGVDWYFSFWDNHERMLGLFTLFHYALYYVFLVAVIQKKEDWRFLMRSFLFAGSLVMLIAFLQKANPDLLLNQGSDRTVSTLGNAIYVGGYGLFLWLLGWYMYTKEVTSFWKTFAAVGSVFGFLGIFASGTRGTMVAIVGALCVGLVVAFFTLGRKQQKQRTAIAGLAIVGVAVLGGLFLLRDTAAVRAIPGVGRLAQTSFETVTEGTRAMAWGVAVDAWKEHPLLGWGPNNYFYAFNKYYRPEFLRFGWGETWFDNAHNVVMNTLATQGIVGVLAYLGIFLAAAGAAVQGYKKHQLSRPALIWILAFLTGHFLHNLTVFENPTSYLYFFFFLAYIQHLVQQPEGEKAYGKVRVSTGKIGGVVGVAVLLIFITNINPGRANSATLDGLRLMSAGQDPTEKIEEALRIPSPHIDDIRSDYARNIQNYMRAIAQAGRMEETKRHYRLAQDELEKNRALHPLNIRNHILQAELAVLMGNIEQDTSYFGFAEAVVEDARAYSPKRQQLAYLLATVKLPLGKGEEAFDLVKQTIADDPVVGEGWWRLAFFHQQMGRVDLAKQTIEEARNAGARFKSHQAEQYVASLESIPDEAATSTVQ